MFIWPVLTSCFVLLILCSSTHWPCQVGCYTFLPALLLRATSTTWPSALSLWSTIASLWSTGLVTNWWYDMEWTCWSCRYAFIHTYDHTFHTLVRHVVVQKVSSRQSGNRDKWTTRMHIDLKWHSVPDPVTCYALDTKQWACSWYKWPYAVFCT